MTLPSITNAHLTKVESKAFTADYDRAGTYGTVKYTGSLLVFLSLTEEQVSTPSESNVLVHRSFVVTDTVSIAFAIDDQVTIDSYGTAIVGTIRAVKASRAPGFDGVIRVILDDA